MLEAEALYTRILFHGMVLIYNNSLEEKTQWFPSNSSDWWTYK